MTCQEQWKHYRKLRWQAFFGWLFGAYLGRFPSDFNVLLYKLCGFYLPMWAFYMLLVICAVIGFSTLIYTWTRLGRWPCPRCGQPFFAWGPFGNLGSNPFKMKCRNCGLRKWQCDKTA